MVTEKKDKSRKLKEYDHSANKKLGDYVRMKYRDQLSNGALQLHLFAMPYFEEKQLGFCQPFTASYDKIGWVACKNNSGLKRLLSALNGVLCDVQFGKSIKGGAEATVIRRYSLAELKAAKKSKLIDKSPDHAKRLSEALARPFTYGDTKCTPFWNIAKTGRVLSRKPNVQGDSKKLRVKKLCQGLAEGQVLLDLDIKQAEPSVIQHVLKYRFDSDPYGLLANTMEIDRQDAKPKLNILAYAVARAVKIIKYWPPEAQELFRDYAEALDEYKEKLWEIGRPKSKQRRFADTLGGSRIYADRGTRIHRGKVMNWHIQGTVADIINTASLEIIQRESTEGWKLCFPVHDSMYVVCKNKQQPVLKEIIIRIAKDLGLDLSVDIEVYTLFEKPNSKKGQFSTSGV